MKCNEIIEILNKEYPLSAAEEWDNVGLLAGKRDSEVSKVLVALDAYPWRIRSLDANELLSPLD